MREDAPGIQQPVRPWQHRADEVGRRCTGKLQNEMGNSKRLQTPKNVLTPPPFLGTPRFTSRALGSGTELDSLLVSQSLLSSQPS